MQYIKCIVVLKIEFEFRDITSEELYNIWKVAKYKPDFDKIHKQMLRYNCGQIKEVAFQNY